MKRLMTVDAMKEVCRDCSVWRSILFNPLGIKLEVKKIMIAELKVSILINPDTKRIK